MFKHLQLQKPLVFIDAETTGVDPRRDRMVELAMVRFAPGMAHQACTIRLNPECAIPVSASAIHGLRDEHVVGCPTFKQAVQRIASFIGDHDLAGFNIARFDLPMLVAEFARVGREFSLRGRKVVDALTLFHRREPRDLAAASRLYCGRDYVGCHQALQDAVASARVLDAMLGRFDDLPRTIPELCQQLVEVDIGGWFSRQYGKIVFARGKHVGSELQQIIRDDRSYLSWLRDWALPDVRRIIDHALRIGNGVNRGAPS